MDHGQPSRTAQATAAARAAHLIVYREPWIFQDSLALVLLGESADELLAAHRDPGPAEPLASMRVAMTTRSHYAEARLAEAARRGVDQYVLLGAGLDSFAYRSPLARRLSIFEVDHPATQAWKRNRLAATRVRIPAQVAFVAVDFRVDSLSDRLAAARFDRSRPAFVSWLGVTQYLTMEAIGAILDVIGGFCEGAELVIEYIVPADMRDEPGQPLADFFMPRAAAFGEPWLAFLTPTETAAALAARSMVVMTSIANTRSIRRSGTGPTSFTPTSSEGWLAPS